MMISQKQAFEILAKFKVPDGVILHSIAVAKKAIEVGERIKATGRDVDIPALKIACILHDIGKIKSRTLDHAEASASMLREIGIDEKIISIVGSHSDQPKEFYEMGIEAKILKYVDCITMHDRITTMDERFEEAAQRREKEGLHNDAVGIRNALAGHKILEKEILKMMEK
jgi:putative nucleotidyltransferase with HDIG domain